MTTEHTPVGTPAENDVDEKRLPKDSEPDREQSSSEETATTVGSQEESIAKSVDSPTSPPGNIATEPEITAGPASTQEASSPEISSDGPATHEIATETSNETTGGSPPKPVAAASVATESTSPPRRVRLNPQAPPDSLKPIPSLRTADAPPAASAVVSQVASPEQAPKTDNSSVPAAAEDPPVRQPEAKSIPESVQEQPVADSPEPPAEPVAIPSKNDALDADLEAELEAAMAGSQQEPDTVAQVQESAADAIAGTPSPDRDVKRGTRLKGVVQSIHGDDMFLEFGLRMAGVLSRRQFGLRKQPMQGEPLEVVVHRIDEKEGLIHVNLPTGTSKVRGDWEALTVDQNVECMVNGTNKGGLEVTVGTLRGFMPASQVELGYVPDLNVYVKQKLKARIAEVNPKRRKLVLSRRSLLEEEREHSQQELFEKVQPGQQYTGRVKTIKDYGAFVDIGGADGLLHVAQISWTRINHPSEVLKEGEEVEVQVLSVDKDKKKISLGMRQLTQNPWKLAESNYTQGAQVTGKVTRIENFGAFVELEEGVEGLVHISELDHKRVKKVTEVLRVGQEVEVQVLEVDPKRKRVGLSVKALKEKPEEMERADASAPIKRQRSVDSLVGGIGKPTGGQLFGDPSKFGG